MSTSARYLFKQVPISALIVWSPTQWPTFMETARKVPRPYQVNILDHTDFIDWQIKSNDLFTKKTMSNKDLRLKDLRVVTFKKNKLNVMEVKYTMQEDGDVYEIPLGLEVEPKTIKGKGKGKSSRSERVDFNDCLPKLYPNRIPISYAKFKDLKKLCDEGTIPKPYQQDYLTLPYDTQVIDTVSVNEESDEEENAKESRNTESKSEENEKKTEPIREKTEKIDASEHRITKKRNSRNIQVKCELKQNKAGRGRGRGRDKGK